MALTRLRIALLEQGRTQRSLARELGLSEPTLSRIVNGLHCDDGTRQAIACALGRDVADLWPDEQDMREAA